ncbi:MAG TPA: hypothetical protein DIT67_10590 [Octadecabacter sp.]|nr:hypothetical protein [Octadecabacter sp.]
MKYLTLLLLTATPAFADTAVVESVTYTNGRFDVTLSHPDTGWDHYADGWRIELADGTILGTRVLAHPHVEEQPFTRSSQIAVPEGVDTVFVRTSDHVDGWADATTPFALN